ncbi:hypothetical protein [Nodularia sp. NIES-3585]|nr:hypothetical protein [Nodularia sp. NIES-3585]
MKSLRFFDERPAALACQTINHLLGYIDIDLRSQKYLWLINKTSPKP